jgi:hypothetical protein
LGQFGGETDTVEMKRCRVAWTELTMFAKCVLRAEQRGVRPSQAYVRAKNRLERWISGERESLWGEVLVEDARARGKKKRKGGISEDVREQRVNKLTALGRAGKAIQGLITPGVAADTDMVRKKLASKFPQRSIPIIIESGHLPQPAGAEIDDFVQQVKSFDPSAGAGPTGLRPQFIREVVGEDGEDPCVQAMFHLSMLFVEGRVPRFLRQWYAGGTLVGIGKDDKPLDEDARPIVVGEYWRRVAGKVALLADKEALSGWLKPCQVAVGVKAGAEAIVHSLRQWWERNRDNTRFVLLKKDYSNAFNEAEPNAFINVACRRMPGAARLAEWCYGEGSNLIYHGSVFKMSTRGQQGDPLMMPMFCGMKQDMRGRIPEVGSLDFAADFADDGVDGGDVDNVFAVLEKEIALGPEYGLRFNYAKMVVYPLAGERFTGDLTKFTDLGIKVDYSGNLKFMQVPIVGDAVFLREWGEQKMGVIRKILEGVRGLSKRHVALYLLRKAGHGCRVVYYLRSTPTDIISDFVHQFDVELKHTFEVVMGLVVNDEQWEQASYPVKESGLGLCRAADIADAAYMASRVAGFDDCVALDRRHVWDDGAPRSQGDTEVIGEWLGGAVRRINGRVRDQSQFALGAKPVVSCRQKDLMGLINKKRRDALLDRASEWDRARLLASSAPHSGSWLEAAPNQVLDTNLTNAEVQYGVGRRLGIELCEECPCPFCLGVMDRWGAHCESCMSGGDKTVIHNAVRDDIYGHSKRAHAAPQLEASGVCRLLGLDVGGDTRERPADVLLCRAQDVVVGVPGGGSSRVALDIGIVCPQAACHLGAASGERLGAAEKYVRTKCARGDIERRCRDAGVVFQPLIFESFGGVSIEADKVLKCLNKAVAGNTDTSETFVATRFWQRIGVDILRGNCRAFHRRLVGKLGRDGVAGNHFSGLSGLRVAEGF